MKVQHKPSNDEVRKHRQAEYLARWPVDKQLEAHAEAAAGRTEKLSAMMADFANIRAVFKFPEEETESVSSEV